MILISMDIPEELETEILLRLPVKSLLKFRSVCKSWCDLITSPSFGDMHYRHPSQQSTTDYMIIPKLVDYWNHTLKFYSRDEDGGLIPMATPSTFPREGGLSLFGPCNGIVYVVSSDTFEEMVNEYLWNPATRECRRIPKSPNREDGYGNNYFLGFGVDPRANEYKAVTVMYLRSTYVIEIYELSSNSWRKVETALPEAMVCSVRDSDGAQICENEWERKGLFFNGCIHWRFEYSIIAFDVSDEVFRLMSDPPVDDPLDTYNDEVLVFEGCLALVSVLASEEQDFVSVWVMTKYGVPESWSKRHSIPIPSYFTKVPENLVPVICWNNDMLVFHDYMHKYLITCNLSGDDFQFRVEKKMKVGESFTPVIIRSESLVSVSIKNPYKRARY